MNTGKTCKANITWFTPVVITSVVTGQSDYFGFWVCETQLGTTMMNSLKPTCDMFSYHITMHRCNRWSLVSKCALLTASKMINHFEMENDHYSIKINNKLSW